GVDAMWVGRLGDRGGVGGGARNLASRLELVRHTMARSWSDQRTRAFAAEICSVGLARRFADFDEARSIGWALTTLHQDRPHLFPDGRPRLGAMNVELGLSIAGQAEPLDRLNDYNSIRFEHELETLLKTVPPTAR